MADYKYAYNGPVEGTARAVIKDAPISTKVAVEISDLLRGKTTEQAKSILERVIKHEQAVPYKKATDGVGHKKGSMAAGRYPEKASKHFIALINVVEANANQAGLATSLKIIHLVPHLASTPYRYGRQRRRQMKQTHVEIVVKEIEGAKRKPAKTQPVTPKAKREEAIEGRESATTTPTTKENNTPSPAKKPAKEASNPAKAAEEAKAPTKEQPSAKEPKDKQQEAPEKDHQPSPAKEAATK